MIKHNEMVAQLAKPGETIVKEMTPVNAHLLHMCMGVSGEAGELVDAIKKSVFYCKPIDYEHIIEELGDIEFYLEGLRQGLGITREQTINANICKLGKRYKGHSYSDKQAIERSDKK